LTSQRAKVLIQSGGQARLGLLLSGAAVFPGLWSGGPACYFVSVPWR